MVEVLEARDVGPLGDGIGSVTLLDHMGDDLAVVNAARVSFNKEAKWKIRPDVWRKAGVLDQKDIALLNYLAIHNHWTPFGHPQLKFRIKAPLFVAREWYRHTVGFIRSEVSGRYVTADKEFYVPTEWRMQAKRKKQGSSDEVAEGSHAYWGAALDMANQALGYYQTLIEDGVAAEQARTILPQSMYTEFVETGSLAAYARLYGLRAAPDAQLETRKYAEAVGGLISPLFPETWSLLTHA